MRQQSTCSCDRVMLTTYERDEELRQVALLHLVAQYVNPAHTQTEQPLSRASSSPDGPSVWPLCPVGYQANGAHRWAVQLTVNFLAGLLVEDQKLISSHLVALSAHVQHEKTASWLDHLWREPWGKPYSHPEVLQTLWCTTLSNVANVTTIGANISLAQPHLLCHSMETVLQWQRKLIKQMTAEDGIFRQEL